MEFRIDTKELMPMNSFIVEVSLPSYFTEEFISLIPDQIAHIRKLLADRTISCYGLAVDRSKVWITMPAESVEDVNSIIEAMPLRKFMQFTVHPLAFVEFSQNAFAHISMN